MFDSEDPFDYKAFERQIEHDKEDPNDLRKIKLVKMKPAEHADLNIKASEGRNDLYILLCDQTYNDYNPGDFVKTDYDTFWKVEKVIYLFRYVEHTFYKLCHSSREKLREAYEKNNCREYSLLQVVKSSYDEAVAKKKTDTGDC